MRKSMKKRQKQQLALLTAVVLVASIAAILLLTPGFDIKKIEVRGNMVIKESEIINSSGIVKGENIFGVNLSEAEDKILETESRVASVKVKRSLPSTITVTVVEEVSVAYLTSEEGYIKITADGRCIEVSDGIVDSGDGKKVTTPPELPKIVGMNNVRYKVGKAITSEDEKQIETLFSCLHEFTKHGYIFDMTEIDVTDINDIKFYYKSKNLCVTLGKNEKDKIGYKMECFGPIYQYVLEKTKEGQMPSGYINLERLTYREKEEIPKTTDTNPKKTQ